MQIMIVDEDSVFCERLSNALKIVEGVRTEVEAFSNVRDAIPRLCAYIPDLVITDMKLLGTGGVPFILQVKMLDQDIRVLIVSECDDYAHVREAFVMKAYDYLLKPVDIERVRSVVKAVAINLKNEYNKSVVGLDGLLAALFPLLDVQTRNCRLNYILSLINTDFGSDISLNTLSGHSGLSESYICRLFKNELRVTYHHYVNLVKIRCAITSLVYEKSLNIRDIALRLGYSTERQFFRVFGSIVGMTPNQFRKTVSQNPRIKRLGA
jgi:YesN/AraC family two-component response regulator